MARILNEQPRDFIEQRRDGDAIVLRNPRTQKSVTLPKSATAHERRQAREQLQESVDDPFAGVKAAEGLDRMARGGEPTPAGDSDPEPYVPVGANRNSPYVLRAEKLHAEWAERQRQKAARETELRTQDRMIERLGDVLQPKPAEQPTPQVVDDGSQYLPEGLRGSFDDFKRQAAENGAGGGGSVDAG